MSATTIRIPQTRSAGEAQGAIRRIALVAVLAIGLGLAMQVLVLLVRLAGGAPVPGIETLAELAGSITWSVLVCTGVAIGVSLGKARAALAGIVGFVFAPLGLAAAKAVQQVILAAIEVAGKSALLSLETVAVVRALEYGVLAFVLVLLTERKAERAGPYLGIGAATGLVFGGTLSALTVLAQMRSGLAPSLAGTGATVLVEVGGPIGCALVIYAGQYITRHTRRFERGSRTVKA